jgi:hypothetical protein
MRQTESKTCTSNGSLVAARFSPAAAGAGRFHQQRITHPETEIF